MLLKLEHLKRFKPMRHLTKFNEINAFKYFWQYFILWQYIAGYTVASYWSYPIRCHVTKSSALEFQNCCFFGLIIACESYDSKHFTSFVMDIFINISVDHGRMQTGGGGGGGGHSGSGPPLKNHKNIEFPNNVDPDPLNITKLPSQHSMVGHYRHASETPFQWRFPVEPMTIHF